MGGNCAYRRSVFERIGGFPAGSFSEDTKVSLALAGSVACGRAGGKCGRVLPGVHKRGKGMTT
jgi:cellulose synthase/poly-beta-1,6-N-acetylglucosamine synthase-like glycosyltransferase